LTLLARGPEAADIVLFPAIAPNAASLPPQLRGRYGWWFYSLGQSDSAAEWLQSAVQELPGDSLLQTRLGWVLIEQHNLESAIERFNTAGQGSVRGYYIKSDEAGRVYPESRVGLAVAQWQAQQFDRALGEFAGATTSQPEWLNPKWVAALYSPEVTKTIEALKAEQKKRRSMHVARNGE